jgi:cytohesin
MKHLLLTTIAAVLVVGCVPKKLQKTKAIPIQQAEPPTVKAPDWSGPRFSIHDATRQGNIETVKQHIAAGAGVNAKDAWGGTPLHEAANEGHEEIAELLIAKGADVNTKDYAGRTPLDRAIDRKRTEIAAINGLFLKRLRITADLLRKHGGKTAKELPPATLLEAVDEVDLQGIKDFLAKGVDVNAKDGTLAPLHLAAFRGYTEVVELLVAAGADVNAKIQERFFGGTPLTRAAYGGHKEIVELLISNGADVNAKNEDDETPLDFAIIRKRTETIDLLRKHGGKTGEELKAEGR